MSLHISKDMCKSYMACIFCSDFQISSQMICIHPLNQVYLEASGRRNLVSNLCLPSFDMFVYNTNKGGSLILLCLLPISSSSLICDYPSDQKKL